MKKGFTLIELLSVIVVLAIISVIAIPTLIGVVNKVKLQSLKSSAYGLIEAGTLYNAQYGNANNARFDIMNNVVTTTEENKIKYKGSVKQGTVIVSTKGKVSVCVTDGKNSAYKNYNDTEVTLVSKKTCSVPANTAVIYLDGEATMDANDAKAILDRLDTLEQRLANSNQGVVKSIQRGTFQAPNNGNGNVTININAVNPSKSIVLFEYAPYGAYNAGSNAITTGCTLVSLNSTNFVANTGATYMSPFTISYQVVEFY